MRRILFGVLAAVWIVAMVQPVWGQEPAKYPNKAVAVIHGFKAGGGSDQLAQLTGPFLEKVLKQQFVNVYKPGADGAIAWREVGKNTKPDGYTLTTVLTPKTQLNAKVMDNAGYTMADFTPVSNMVFDPGVLVVGTTSKFKTVKELLDAAKKDAGNITMGHSGNAGDDWFNAIMIERLAGVKFNLVPFEGDGPATQAAAGNHIDACSSNISIVVPLVKAGKLLPLAVYSEKRLPMLPDVPTLKELGVNLVEGSYRGFLAPKGTPTAIVDILADAMEKVANDPEYRKICEGNNLVVDFKRGEANQKWLREQDDKLGKIVQEMGLGKK